MVAPEPNQPRVSQLYFLAMVEKHWLEHVMEQEAELTLCDIKRATGLIFFLAVLGRPTSRPGVVPSTSLDQLDHKQQAGGTYLTYSRHKTGTHLLTPRPAHTHTHTLQHRTTHTHTHTLPP